MPEHDVTHRDLWVAITNLGGKVDSILLMMQERKEEVQRITKDLDSLFSRQRALEGRMSQVLILGALIALLIPCAATIWAAKIAAPQVEIRQRLAP